MESTFHVQLIIRPRRFASICFHQWGLLVRADRSCLWIHRAALLTHAYLSWRWLCPRSGIWLQPYNQLGVINRNTGRTNLAVTTNKHLWGRLKASRGFLLHINALDNTDAEACVDTHMHWHSIRLLPPIHLLRRLLSSPAYYFDLQKQTPSLPLDSEISRLVCLLEKTKGARSTQRFIKWHHRSGREETELTGASKAYL